MCGIRLIAKTYHHERKKSKEKKINWFDSKKERFLTLHSMCKECGSNISAKKNYILYSSNGWENRRFFTVITISQSSNNNNIDTGGTWNHEHQNHTHTHKVNRYFLFFSQFIRHLKVILAQIFLSIYRME